MEQLLDDRLMYCPRCSNQCLTDSTSIAKGTEACADSTEASASESNAQKQTYRYPSTRSKLTFYLGRHGASFVCSRSLVSSCRYQLSFAAALWRRLCGFSDNGRQPVVSSSSEKTSTATAPTASVGSLDSVDCNSSRSLPSHHRSKGIRERNEKEEVIEGEQVKRGNKRGHGGDEVAQEKEKMGVFPVWKVGSAHCNHSSSLPPRKLLFATQMTLRLRIELCKNSCRPSINSHSSKEKKGEQKGNETEAAALVKENDVCLRLQCYNFDGSPIGGTPRTVTATAANDGGFDYHEFLRPLLTPHMCALFPSCTPQHSTAHSSEAADACTSAEGSCSSFCQSDRISTDGTYHFPLGVYERLYRCLHESVQEYNDQWCKSLEDIRSIKGKATSVSQKNATTIATSTLCEEEEEEAKDGHQGSKEKKGRNPWAWPQHVILDGVPRQTLQFFLLKQAMKKGTRMCSFSSSSLGEEQRDADEHRTETEPKTKRKDWKFYCFQRRKISSEEEVKRELPAWLWDSLRPFQRTGIIDAVSRNGRSLFGDEMGTGKSVQALVTVAVLKAFPLLILCPSTARHVWAEEIEKWMSDFVDIRTDLHIVFDSNDKLPQLQTPKFVVCSYKMAVTLSQDLLSRKWGCVIGDESHILHTNFSFCSTRFSSYHNELGASAERNEQEVISNNENSKKKLAAADAPLQEEEWFSDEDGETIPVSFSYPKYNVEEEEPKAAAECEVSETLKQECEDGLEERDDTVQSTEQPSHQCPQKDAMYTELFAKLSESTVHCLLLSGTPSLLRPYDLYRQLDFLYPGLWGDGRMEFAVNYSVFEGFPHLQPTSSSRAEEMRLLLRECTLTRRLKSEVLKELPSKQRVLLRVPCEEVKQEREMCNQSTFTENEQHVESTAAGNLDGDVSRQQHHETHPEDHNFQRGYTLSGKRKLSGTSRVVTHFARSFQQQQRQVCDTGNEFPQDESVSGNVQKLVCYAHHIFFLDSIEAALVSARIGYVRIDGGCNGPLRAHRISQFQTSPDCIVALVGTTACAIGISFTVAHCCVFAELPPNASWLLQAEDRLHRIGQEGAGVMVYVCIGADSAFDAHHWAMMERSYQHVRAVVDGPGEHSLDAVKDVSSDNWTAHFEGQLKPQETGKIPRNEREERPQSACTVVSDPTATLRQKWLQNPLPQEAISQGLSFLRSKWTGRVHCFFFDEKREGLPRCLKWNVAQEDLSQLLEQEANDLPSTSSGIKVKKDNNKKRCAFFWILEQMRDFLELRDRLTPLQRRVFCAVPRTNCQLRNYISSLQAKGVPDQVDPLSKSAAVQVGDTTPVESQNFGQISSVLTQCGGSGIGEKTEKLARYLPRWSTNWVPPGQCLWMWWRVGGSECRPTTTYPSLVRRKRVSVEVSSQNYLQDSFEILCKTCNTVLSLPRSFRPAPGTVVDTATDSIMFCSGSCRAAFFIRRNGASLRRQLESDEKGFCSSCGLNGLELTSRLQSTPFGLREVILREAWPQLVEECPDLIPRLLEKPSAGLVWQADHLIPVSQGGGLAGLDNLQTLCVVCHQRKTRKDAERLSLVRNSGATATRKRLRTSSSSSLVGCRVASAQTTQEDIAQHDLSGVSVCPVSSLLRGLNAALGAAEPSWQSTSRRRKERSSF